MTTQETTLSHAPSCSGTGELVADRLVFGDFGRDDDVANRCTECGWIVTQRSFTDEELREYEADWHLWKERDSTAMVELRTILRDRWRQARTDALRIIRENALREEPLERIEVAVLDAALKRMVENRNAFRVLEERCEYFPWTHPRWPLARRS